MKINNKIKKIFKSIDHAIVDLNSQNMIIDFTKNIEKIINISNDKLEKQNIQVIFQEKEQKSLATFLNSNDNECNAITLQTIKNDNLILNISFSHENETKKLLIHNENHIEKEFDNINKLAFYDHLTNLPNINLFHDRTRIAINQAKRNNAQICICYMDIDDFKKINDSFGHHVGDELLMKFAHRLEKAIRNTDTLSRVGGDEFLLLTQNITCRNDMELILNRIIKTNLKKISINNKKIKINMSIGISIYPDNGNDLKTLIKKADDAMYECKKNNDLHYMYYEN